MSHSCFIHSSTDRHWSCFHILAIVNNMAINIGVLMFFQISVWGFFGYIPRSGIAGSKGRSIFNFWDISILLSTVATPVCIPVCNSAKWFPFLHTLTSTCLFIYWWWSFWQVWDGIFKNILLIMLLQLSHFPPFTPLHPAHRLPPTSCQPALQPWVCLCFDC